MILCGYQKDPVLSETKLRAAVENRARRGFRLHDPSTWHHHRRAVVPDRKRVWTADLVALVPRLAALAHANDGLARAFIETVLAFVASNHELSERMIGGAPVERRSPRYLPVRCRKKGKRPAC